MVTPPSPTVIATTIASEPEKVALMIGEDDYGQRPQDARDQAGPHRRAQHEALLLVGRLALLAQPPAHGPQPAEAPYEADDAARPPR